MRQRPLTRISNSIRLVPIGCWMVGICFLGAGVDQRLQAQDFSFRSAVEKLSPANLFKRSGKSESPALRPGSQPTELKVTGRATAQRMAGLRVPDREASTEPFDRRVSSAGTGYGGAVEPAAYQQPTPQVYSTPQPNEPMSSGYPMGDQYNSPENYQRDYAPDGSGQSPMLEGSSGQYAPQSSAWANPNAGLHGAVDQPIPREVQQRAFSNSAQGNSLPGYPAPANPIRGPASQQPEYNNQTVQNLARPMEYGSVIDPADQRQFANSHFPHGFESANEQAGTRGYLQNGYDLHGRRLNRPAPLATERALELQDENERLRETIRRTQLELDNRTQDLVEARSAATVRDEELARSNNRVDALNAQLARLNNDLKLAIQENQDIQRRSDEQFRAIESTLDGVLMNSISKSGEGR